MQNLTPRPGQVIDALADLNEKLRQQVVATNALLASIANLVHSDISDAQVREALSEIVPRPVARVRPLTPEMHAEPQ